MNTRLVLSLLCATAVSVGWLPLQAANSATVGQPAPNFKLEGANGKMHSLSSYAGKYVVLEWTNPSCPFVGKFYGSNTMQSLQKSETASGVVWLRINSGAPGHDGYQTPAQMASYVTENHVAATASLVDPTGKVGHMYGARNTPQMFVINPKGTLIYAGGIDNKPSTDPSDIATATNYVKAALDEAKAGKAVRVATAPPYGCSVKYADD
jgi:hypothetical protein